MHINNSKYVCKFNIVGKCGCIDTKSFRFKLFWDELKQWNCTKVSKSGWTRRTHDVNTPCSIRQLCKTIDTSTESTCIETTCNETSLYRKDRYQKKRKMYYMLHSKTRCSARAKHLFGAVGLFILLRKCLYSNILWMFKVGAL